MKKYLFVKSWHFQLCLPVLIVRAMRITIFLTLVCVVNLHAEGHSQKKLTLSLKDVKLSQVFNVIQQQTNYQFLYNDEDIQEAPLVNVIVKRATVPQILAICFTKSYPLEYRIEDSTVIVLKKTAVLHTIKIPARIEIPQFTVKGKITDSLGNPLIGVSVSLKGTSTGTITDAKGNYSLTLGSENGTLVFSYVGYAKKEVAVNGRPIINVQMSKSVSSLNQLVVVGYGQRESRRLTTGAVSQVSGEVLEGRGLSTVAKGLQGEIPGLNITATNQGGAPGSKQNINIRGIGSLSGGSPYILVDGIPQDLSTINPQDIKSVTVLKDASAAAIYGSRAAFGVILVTTKRGNRGEEMEISYNTNIGWDRPTVLPKKLNSLEYALTLNQAAENSNQPSIVPKETIERIKAYMKDPAHTPTTIPLPNNPNRWSSFHSTTEFYANANVDAYEALLKDWALKQTHNLSLRGGSDKISYYFSGGFFNRKGQMRYGKDKFNRYSLLSNTNIYVTKWLDFSVNAKYINREIERPHVYSSSNDAGGRYFFEMARVPPTVALYAPDGKPLMRLFNVLKNGGRDKISDNQFSGGLKATINPLPGWEIVGNYNIRGNFNSGELHKKMVSDYLVDGSKLPIAGTFPTDFNKHNNQSNYQSINIYTSYEKDFGMHHFKGILGSQKETYKYSNLQARKTDLITDEVPSLETATGQQYINAGMGHWGTEGIFGRLNYNYEEKYLISLNGRYDGSSRFPQGHRWGFFPSISIGYNIANEPFWDNLKKEINFLKLRASYGSLGNQAVPNYLYISNYGIHTTSPWIVNGNQPLYITAGPLISEDITWETVRSLDVGVDASLFNNNFSLMFDWFQRNTLNMLGPVKSYPGVLGTSAPKTNNANLRSRGFELKLGWRNNIGSVNYNIGFRLSNHKDVVTKFNNEKGLISDYYAGMELGSIWGYTTVGLFPSDDAAQKNPVDQSFFYPVWTGGDVQYKDINGDGEINDGSRTLDGHGDLSIIGNSSPQFNYGLNLGLQWNGFDFSMFWQGVGKRDLWINGAMFWGIGNNPGVRNGTYLRPMLDYWRLDNKDAYYPKPYIKTSEWEKNRQVQTRYLQNASYLRLKNVRLSFSIPKPMLNKINIKQLDIYIYSENLLLFSPIVETFDPEVATKKAPSGAIPGQVYPLAKTIGLGLNVSL